MPMMSNVDSPSQLSASEHPTTDIVETRPDQSDVETDFGTQSVLTLSQSFGFMGGLVMLAAMAIIGSWVSSRIEAGVVRNTAVATALYMESFVAPLSQELSQSESLSPESIKSLDELLTDTPIGERVVSFKIWRQGGRIVHASDRSLIGKTFTPTEALRNAWSGQVTAEFDELHDAEDAHEHDFGLPLLEIYSPIREAWSQDIIAVAEFYEVATGLEKDLIEARFKTWVMVAIVMIGASALLFGIVHRGSRTISRQQVALQSQVEHLRSLVTQNDRLRQRVQRASSRVSELNEHYLRRISAELHDGPAQFLGFAALRLGSLSESAPGKDFREEMRVVRGAIDEAIHEIRATCNGLALPDLEDMPLSALALQAINGHKTLTHTDVDVDNSVPDDVRLDHSQKICVYRFLQEGLANAARHADAKDQRVEMRLSKGAIEIVVTDGGPGFDGRDNETEKNTGLGLAGLRERVESLGGSFHASDRVGGGAILAMTLPLNWGAG